jgi:hypothetical protein
VDDDLRVSLDKLIAKFEVTLTIFGKAVSPRFQVKASLEDAGSSTILFISESLIF